MIIVVVPVQASAEDQLQRVGQAQACGEVDAVLGGYLALVVRMDEVRFPALIGQLVS